MPAAVEQALSARSPTATAGPRGRAAARPLVAVAEMADGSYGHVGRGVPTVAVTGSQGCGDEQSAAAWARTRW